MWFPNYRIKVRRHWKEVYSKQQKTFLFLYIWINNQKCGVLTKGFNRRIDNYCSWNWSFCSCDRPICKPLHNAICRFFPTRVRCNWVFRFEATIIIIITQYVMIREKSPTVIMYIDWKQSLHKFMVEAFFINLWHTHYTYLTHDLRKKKFLVWFRYKNCNGLFLYKN